MSNQWPGPQRQPVVAQEKTGDRAPINFITRPSTRITFGGFPVLDGQELVITRAGRDPYVDPSLPRQVPQNLVVRVFLSCFDLQGDLLVPRPTDHPLLWLTASLRGGSPPRALRSGDPWVSTDPEVAPDSLTPDYVVESLLRRPIE